MIELVLPTKEEWIDALRSGQYEQTKGKLKRSRDQDTTFGERAGFCCLGVYCDLVEKKNPGIVKWDEDDDFVYPATEEDEEWHDNQDNLVELTGELSPVFLDALGLNRGQQSTLIELNDDYDYDFQTIADVVESGIIELPEEEEGPCECGCEDDEYEGVVF